MAQKCERSEPEGRSRKELHILNLGAGVQSTTLYLMAMEGSAPRYDYAIFADTQEEPEAVYQHLNWLQTMAGPPILIRSLGSLGDALVNGSYMFVPVFLDGKPGKRQCSSNYKIEVINRCIRQGILGLKPRQRIPSALTVHQYFGISWDEKSRASRIWERFHVTDESKFEPHFPLIERMMTRANCLEWLKNRVPHEVPRSACVFCPMHSDTEWEDLKNKAGSDWFRVLEIDRSLRPHNKYLHRSSQPIDEVDFRPRINRKELQLGFDIECEGVCGL